MTPFVRLSLNYCTKRQRQDASGHEVIYALVIIYAASISFNATLIFLVSLEVAP
jgi:hypothetical protein